MLKITADTNTLISATIAKGNEFELLRLVKLRKIKLILSLQILKEFREVISRPKFGFSQEQIVSSFKQIINISTIVMPSANINIIKEDPDDNRVLECAESGQADYIVSGDYHLLDLKIYKGIKIVSTKFVLDIINK